MPQATTFTSSRPVQATNTSLRATPARRSTSAVVAPPRASPAAPPGPVLSPANEAWADYLDLAGRNAFADGNYDAASRYWQDASRSSPRRAAELAEPIARAQLLATERR